MKTRLLLWLLMATVVVGNVNAATFVVENLSYEKINDETCRVVGHDMDVLTIVIPESVIYEEHTYRVTEIGRKAFSNDRLMSVTIPNSVTLIGESAFDDCRSLSSIAIPNSVTEIGNNAFWGCFGLKSVTIPGSVISMGESAFANCLFLASVTLSENITVIKKKAFSNCAVLSTIVIPNGVTMIEELAFEGCDGLASITIPASVTEIGEGAFVFCRGLTSLTISEGVGLIREQAFNSCVGLTSVTIPGSVTSIGVGAFSGCSHLSSVVISDGVTDIAGTAFALCGNLTSITLPASITSIAESAFSSCIGLNSIEVSSDSKSYSSSDGVLFNKTQTSLIIYPAGKRNHSYTVPDGVTAIGDNAFSDCAYLASVTISGNVTTIGADAFSNCLDIKDFYCVAETPPVISRTTFESYGATLHIPAGCKPAYKAADYWKNFTKMVEDVESAVDNVGVGSSVSYQGGILSLQGNDVPATICVYTLDGKCVLTCRMAAGEEACDLSSLAEGIYLVRVKAGKETSCFKIVK